MNLIDMHSVSVGFGGALLLDEATLQIETGERIGLVGRNGAGKTTLLRLLNGHVAADEGDVVRQGGVRISLLPQEVPDNLPGTVYEVTAQGNEGHLKMLQAYSALTRRLGRSGSEALLRELEDLQHRLETSGAWHHHLRVETILARTGLDGHAEFRLLSAGMKRRVFLAKALVNEPDLLLLDEPTNHLDLDAILWLEAFLLAFEGTLLFVTHDRTFLQKLATRIVEIDRGRLLSFSCDYRTYLERRQSLMEAEERERQRFDQRLAGEETWIRQGIKARRTRNEGRVRALESLREERARRRERTGNVRLAIQEAQRSGRLVVEADKISFSYGDVDIVRSFSTLILRGDRVGILGPNGSGKTTLLRLLLGELVPREGSLRLGTGLRIAYFDQLRSCLDETRTLQDIVADGNDTVFIDGSPRHIVGYLRDFLFPPDQIRVPVASLSGGERNRLLLARLFSTPSNVLVLDEPTNDLDAETLELLEERLLTYNGTILLVSHDRSFLNNVVTSTMVFEGNGRLTEYVGGYDDWVQQRDPAVVQPSKQAAERTSPKRRERPPREKDRLTYREARELETLPGIIDTLEAEKEALVARLSDPAFYVTGDPSAVKASADRLEALETELDAAYARWENLEAFASGQTG